MYLTYRFLDDFLLFSGQKNAAILMELFLQVGPFIFLRLSFTSLHFTSLLLVEPPLPVVVEVLHKAFHLSHSRAISLTPFRLSVWQ